MRARRPPTTHQWHSDSRPAAARLGCPSALRRFSAPCPAAVGLLRTTGRLKCSSGGALLSTGSQSGQLLLGPPVERERRQDIIKVDNRMPFGWRVDRATYRKCLEALNGG